MIFTTFENAIIIQPEKLQNAQTTYQMKDKDHIIILIKFFSKFFLKTWKKLELKNLFS